MDYAYPEGLIQLGLPLLPTPGDQVHVQLLRNWLEDCDIEHHDCKISTISRLPKRLLAVGQTEGDPMRLCEGSSPSLTGVKYIALSHRWGDGQHFCTTTLNLAQFMQDIEFTDLPKTFQDAVKISRALSIGYLWIDSLCIVQGPGGDFNEQAKLMQDVFSQAYCVLAASSSAGQDDGFLQRREDSPKSLSIPGKDDAVIHIGRFMDDFNGDVLESQLSRRGWVLQERALARRTIYFTDKQTYWECGMGVRCESMTKTWK